MDNSTPHPREKWGNSSNFGALQIVINSLCINTILGFAKIRIFDHFEVRTVLHVFRDRLHWNKYGDYCKKMGSGKLVRQVHFFSYAFLSC